MHEGIGMRRGTVRVVPSLTGPQSLVRAHEPQPLPCGSRISEGNITAYIQIEINGPSYNRYKGSPTFYVSDDAASI